MSAKRTSLRFICGDADRELSGFDPTLTILDWLRLDERRMGTKEGCAEGDCGACTVVVGKLDGDRVVYRAIDACIAPLACLDGHRLLTVEHLKRDGVLHPVQQAMVDQHGSQCGFCTPGIVMSLFALWLEEDAASEERIEDALAGNLCRCTGYQPIIAAGTEMFRQGAVAKAEWRSEQASMVKRLTALRDDRMLEIVKDGRSFVAPADLDSFAEAYARDPDATIVAGATDAGLWITKEMRVLNRVLYPGRIAALSGVTDAGGELTIGAMTSLTDATEALGHIHPQLGELLRRFGGEQVRNAGTVGGNIANGSPIGDLPPALIALGATLLLRHGKERRELPLEAFFLAYKQQDRRPGEFVEAVRVPKLDAASLFHASKISKRFDEDISALCGAFHLTLDAKGAVAAARLAYGGMAGTPKRAAAAEAALIGQPWDEEAAERAAAALEQDFKPLDDWRASSRYRMLCAQNLLRRFAIESGETIETRVAGRLADIRLARRGEAPTARGI
ncbi:xanthine dehydrogenase small subunit [Rhizobiales bacterium GAS191]|nr:xanthine dehydrogenase small subunit [Rhizobiales bacterium GAS113]SED97108.1 xanthine dehydrogenase small subunit [Rhizobiales bacterium GAS191]SEE51256.1 xanthine dehydrogenase small subunit [Rhizobiales bacterium GAS188]